MAFVFDYNFNQSTRMGYDRTDFSQHILQNSEYAKAKFRDQKAFRRGPWKYLAMDGNEYLFDLAADARERANKALLEPRRLEAMRHAYEAWSATMPPIAPDAWVGFPHRAELLANPS